MLIPAVIIEKVFLPVLVASVLAVGVAYVDIKSDMAVGKEKDQTQEKQLEKIDKKLDKLMDYIIEGRPKNDSNDSGE